jgi:hypothetical protein
MRKGALSARDWHAPLHFMKSVVRDRGPGRWTVAGHLVATRISAGCLPFPTVRPLIRRRQALALRSAVSEALRTILRTAMQQPAIAAARQTQG